MGNKMKEWFEANQEIYAEFKSKIHSTLDILSQDGTNVAECDETYSLQNMLLEAMAAKNMPDTQSQQAGFIYLILCTVSGVAAGLQNTG